MIESLIDALSPIYGNKKKVFYFITKWNIVYLNELISNYNIQIMEV